MLNVTRCFTLVSPHTGWIFILLWSCAGSPSGPPSNGFLLNMISSIWLLLLFHLDSRDCSETTLKRCQASRDKCYITCFFRLSQFQSNLKTLFNMSCISRLFLGSKHEETARQHCNIAVLNCCGQFLHSV